jgi:hypothetical protein
MSNNKLCQINLLKPLFFVLGIWLSSATASDGTAHLWAYMNRESNFPCLPMATTRTEFAKPLAIQQAMSLYSSTKFKVHSFALEGTSESVPLFVPDNHAAPLMTRESCLKLVSWARAQSIPDHAWTQQNSPKQ